MYYQVKISFNIVYDVRVILHGYEGSWVVYRHEWYIKNITYTIRNPRFWGRFGETSDVFRDVTMFGNKRPQSCKFYWTLRET